MEQAQTSIVGLDGTGMAQVVDAVPRARTQERPAAPVQPLDPCCGLAGDEVEESGPDEEVLHRALQSADGQRPAARLAEMGDKEPSGVTSAILDSLRPQTESVSLQLPEQRYRKVDLPSPAELACHRKLACLCRPGAPQAERHDLCHRQTFHLLDPESGDTSDGKDELIAHMLVAACAAFIRRGDASGKGVLQLAQIGRCQGARESGRVPFPHLCQSGSGGAEQCSLVAAGAGMIPVWRSAAAIHALAERAGAKIAAEPALLCEPSVHGADAANLGGDCLWREPFAAMVPGAGLQPGPVVPEAWVTGLQEP
ncbi:hypothetical protein [Mangrovicoccus ximenensis]|uniref:hypothetical protein n=1 Tax=Mangrovicoccus ximenensis TaxID=1911570 RepID=UPI0011AE64C3|nr:hypothetical protein [Mangrovicoccus ximenensis]